MLETIALSIGYCRKRQHQPIQNDLNLQIRESEMIALIGPNGCGKSTLLRTLCGLQPALSGEILVNKEELSAMSVRQKACLFALVLTEKVQLTYCTVRQLVSMGRYPYRMLSGEMTAEDEKIVDKAMERVHLSNFAERPVSELSDGEYQRVMIAKALAQDTRLIFLDEPTAHLDLPNRVEVMLLLKALSRETGKSILISTHELELAMRTSDRLWLMRPDGGGVRDGAPSELMAKGLIQEVFKNELFGFEAETGRVLIF